MEENPALTLDTAEGLALMRAGPVRDPRSGAGVAVAVVDTGINHLHPALGGGAVPNSKVICGHKVALDKPDIVDEWVDRAARHIVLNRRPGRGQDLG